MGNWKPSRISPDGIVARVVAPAEDKFDGKVTELRLVVGHQYKDRNTGEYKDSGQTWLTYSAAGEYADNLRSFGKGDLVEITGSWSLETRQYTDKNAVQQNAVGVRWGNIELLERKGEGRQAEDQNSGFGGDDRPF